MVDLLGKHSLLAMLMFVNLYHFSNRTSLGECREVRECRFAVVLTKLLSDHSLRMSLPCKLPFSHKGTSHHTTELDDIHVDEFA